MTWRLFARSYWLAVAGLVVAGLATATVLAWPAASYADRDDDRDDELEAHDVEEDDTDDDDTDEEVAGTTSNDVNVKINVSNDVRSSASVSNKINVKSSGDGQTDAKIITNGTKIEVHGSGDGTQTTVTTPDGEVRQLDDNADVTLEHDGTTTHITVRTLTKTDGSSDTRIMIEDESTQAVTSFPVTVDAATSTVLITTSAGQRTVKILPDQAVVSLQQAGLIDTVSDRELTELLESRRETAREQVIELTERNGILTYVIAGTKFHRFLGFIPATTQTTVIVSAETGETISIERSFTDRLIAFFS